MWNRNPRFKPKSPKNHKKSHKNHKKSKLNNQLQIKKQLSEALNSLM
jgi:hypothetical protein